MFDIRRKIADLRAEPGIQDFRYLVFPGATDESMLDGALEVYEPLLGLQLDRGRIRLGNAACAIGFLAFRCCTLAESAPAGALWPKTCTG